MIGDVVLHRYAASARRRGVSPLNGPFIYYEHRAFVLHFGYFNIRRTGFPVQPSLPVVSPLGQLRVGSLCVRKRWPSRLRL